MLKPQQPMILSHLLPLVAPLSFSVFPIKDPAFSLSSVLVVTPVPELEGPLYGVLLSEYPPLALTTWESSISPAGS